ncbi:protein starmaker-like [Juglans regia]|uniref:Protein starmaker-like n=2 Tax=Juglans regia TaxID=51240 RepID=A0A2I4GP63_JUGRE|nr:protein starmaker-like [Juglans regia]
MYNGIGLQTPRGSGTNGYIQSNRFLIKSKTGRIAETTKGFEENQGTAGITRKPNKDILEHDRKRQIELKIVLLQDTLVDQGYTDAEIAEKLEDARKTLEGAAATYQDGPTAIDVASNKLSETQTHQIAARKEKQLETLRAAFGISAPELDEHNIEGNDDARDGRKNVPSDNIKREHAFLDREFRSKKNMEEDQKVEKDDKKKGVKESGRHKKEESKRRRHETDSSDTDSSGKHAKGLQANHHRSNRWSDHESDSDIAIDKKHKPSKKHKKSRVHDSDDSDSATHSGENVDVRKTSKNKKKSRVRYSDDSDSDRYVGKKHKTSKKHWKNRKHDSDDSDSDSDSDSATDEDGNGHESPKKQAKYKKSSRRHGSDDDSDFDEGSPKRRGQNGNQQIRTSGRHDSEDEADDTNNEVEEKRIQLEKENNQHSRGRWKEGGESDVEDLKKSSNGRHGKRSRMNDVVDENDFERASKHKREITDKSLRSRRHDSDADDDFGTGTDEQINKGRIRRHNTDEDYGVSYDRRNANMTAGKHKTVEEAAVSLIDDIDNGLYRSRRDTINRSRYRSQEVMKGKRNLDDGKEDGQPDSKLSSRNYVKEAEHAGEQWKDSKIGYELNTREHLSKDDHKRDTRLRSVRQHDSETVEQGGRSYKKDDEPQRISRKDDREHEELGGRGRQSRYEEEHRGRKHRRDEDYEYTRHERANAEQRGGNRRQARGEEEEQENRSHEMDRRMDYSKRARYDDLRSSERKRYDDRRDDDRARR